MKEKIKYYSKKLNQVILVFPIWISLGLMKPFKRNSNHTGWEKKEKNTDYEKMY